MGVLGVQASGIDFGDPCKDTAGGLYRTSPMPPHAPSRMEQVKVHAHMTWYECTDCSHRILMLGTFIVLESSIASHKPYSKGQYGHHT